MVVTTDGDRIFEFNFGDYFNPANQIVTNTKKQGKKVNFCDVSSLADMLNNEYENEILEQ